MPPLNKSKRHSGRRHSKNILIAEEIPHGSIGSRKRVIPSLIQKKDSSMINMVKRESKMADLQALEISLISSTRRKTIGLKR